MKRRIMGTLKFSPPEHERTAFDDYKKAALRRGRESKTEARAKRDAFRREVDEILARMCLHHSQLTDDDEEGNPQTSVDVSPEAFEDADGFFDFLEEQMEKIPELHGSFTIHNCSHDDPNPKPCIIEREVRG